MTALYNLFEFIVLWSMTGFSFWMVIVLDEILSDADEDQSLTNLQFVQLSYMLMILGPLAWIFGLGALVVHKLYDILPQNTNFWSRWKAFWNSPFPLQKRKGKK